MKAIGPPHRLIVISLLVCSACVGATAQRARPARVDEGGFGPNVRAYLRYLRNEQEVVDDRVSRREIDRRYYVHNLNRIHALRQTAIRIARETENDYLPELEAVSLAEFEQLFEPPLPKPSNLREGETLEDKLRFLGSVTAGREKFYLFARLDPYEQSELRKKNETKAQPNARALTAQPSAGDSGVRPRRVSSP
jgi:hypothetical protein